MPSALQREAPWWPTRHWLVSVVPQTAQARGGPESGPWADETKRPRVQRPCDGSAGPRRDGIARWAGGGGGLGRLGVRWRPGRVQPGKEADHLY
jgi:hypothetical protein